MSKAEAALGKDLPGAWWHKARVAQACDEGWEHYYYFYFLEPFPKESPTVLIKNLHTRIEVRMLVCVYFSAATRLKFFSQGTEPSLARCLTAGGPVPGR